MRVQCTVYTQSVLTVQYTPYGRGRGADVQCSSIIRHNPRFRRTIDLRVWRYHIPEVNSVLDCACVVGWPTRNDGCYVALWRHGLMTDSTRDPSLLPPSRVLNCRMLLNIHFSLESPVSEMRSSSYKHNGACVDVDSLWYECTRYRIFTSLKNQSLIRE